MMLICPAAAAEEPNAELTAVITVPAKNLGPDRGWFVERRADEESDLTSTDHLGPDRGWFVERRADEEPEDGGIWSVERREDNEPDAGGIWAVERT